MSETLHQSTSTALLSSSSGSRPAGGTGTPLELNWEYVTGSIHFAVTVYKPVQ